MLKYFWVNCWFTKWTTAMVCLANLVGGSTIPSIFITLGMACFERNDAVITV